MPSCSVPYCTSASNKDSEITFHEFPHKTPLFLSTWLKKIGRPCWRPGLRSLVCSKHFVKDDFDRSGKLRVGSIPTVFPEPPSRKKKKKIELNQNANNVNTLNQVALNSPSQGKSVKKDANLPLDSCIVKVEACASHEPEITVKIEKIEGCYSVGSVASLSDSNLDSVDLVSEGTVSLSEPQVINSSNEKSASNSDDSNCSSAVDANPIETSQKTQQECSGSSAEMEDGRAILKRKRNDAECAQATNASNALITNAPSAISLVSCRICGHTSSLNIPIFGKEGLKADLAGLINKYLPIKVAQTDSLPLNICDGCISRLKICQDMMISCGRTDNIFRAGALNEPLCNINSTCSSPSEASIHVKLAPKHQKNADSKEETFTIHKQTVIDKSNVSGLSRILLLEMPCQEQVPVKTMISQAIEELKLRLQPKDTRKCKPHGRIMFLDLQGGRAAYPEQMSKAVAMMFANGSTDGTKKKVIAPLSSSPVAPSSKSAQTPLTAPSLVKVAPTKGLPSTSFMRTSLSPRTFTTPSLPVSVPTTIQISPLSSASIPTPLTCTALPHSLPPVIPPTNVKTLLTLPSSQSFPNLIQLPANSVPIQIQSQFGNGVETVSPSFPRLVPVSVSNTKNVDVSSFPTVISLEANENKNASNVDLPVKTAVDIASMREKVLTKINSKGKQFKLGDKIVGIVLRNSESSEEIQKKLQATFSKPAIVPKPSLKPKERPIAPKGSEEINIGNSNIETTIVTDFVENVKKSRGPIIDICSSPDEFCSYYERRQSHKPTLGFMWQKTAYLASSYQKLFTWVPPFGPGTMPVLSCRVCCRTVSSKTEVENHLQSHPDLQCTVCQKYFLTVDKVQEHVKIIHLLTPQDMPRKKTFITWRHNALRRQVLKQFQCSRCERRYKQREALERHSIVCKQKTLAEKVVAISNANLLSCPVCNKNMSTNSALQEHMLVHTKRTSWLCDICGQVLKTQSNYRSHTARHEELAHHFKYQCKVCKKRFKLLNRYTEHEKSHEVQRQFMCPSCGKVFRTLNGLRQHEILHGERKLQCRFCPSRFHRRDHLRIHEACHNKPPNKSQMPRNFRCRFCPASEESGRFPNMKQLMDHYAQAHDLERGKIPGSHKYSCDRCPRTFVNSTLLRHHFMWHDGERPYHCSTCGQGFMVKERLRNHENIHTNERPHKCQQCGKGFRSRHVLKQHKKVHSDPSTHFRCQYCQKGFSRIDNLRTHELVHTGVKPWKCAICLRQFRIRADCAKHISVTHQLSPADVQLNIENVTEASTSNQEPTTEESVKTISSVDTIEFLLEDDDMVEEEEEAIE